MRYLYLDTETFSAVPITSGTHAYAEHAEIMICTWALDDGPVQVHDVYVDSMDQQFLSALQDPDVTVVIHNSHFDRTIIRHVWGYDIPTSRIHDTMIQALSHGLPGSLGALCEVLGLPADKAKDKEGKKLINLFCKPLGKNRKLDRGTHLTHPAEWEKFKSYAASDIVAMREIMKLMPMVNMMPVERELWQLDQKINDRGVAIDMELVHAAITAVDLAQVGLAAQTLDMTEGAVASTTKTAALRLQLFEMFGIDMPDMRMATVEKTIADPTTPPAMIDLLNVRLQASSTSTSKYKVLRKGTSNDGRLRGTLQFNGASRTGRWAGRLFQPQNLPRPSLKQPVIDAGIEALKAGAAHLTTDNVMELISSSIRGCIVAPKGKKLVVADLANIEGRVQAWLANEEWKLQAFRDFDTITGVDAKGKAIRLGPDLYKLAYSKSFGVTPESVTDDQRQVGKVMELACFGPDTPVITNTGVKLLYSITTEDLLWDGIQWVQHQGLISKGLRPTINLVGIEVTPDHLIKTGATWTQAQQLVLNESILCQALATGSENLPSCGVFENTKALVRRIWSKSNVPAVQQHTKYSRTTYVKEPAHDAIAALKSKLGIGVKAFLNTLKFAPMRNTAIGYSIAYPPVIQGVIQKQPNNTQHTVVEGYSYSMRGAQINGPFYRIWSGLKAGIYQLWNLIGSITIRAMNPVICASSLSSKTTGIVEQFPLCKSESKNLRPTYDILNAGVNRCFTVISDRGPLIVHNCAYEGGVGAFHTFASAYGINLDDLAERTLPTAPEWAVTEADGFFNWAVKTKRDRYGLSDDAFVACDTVKRVWRHAHLNIASYWGRLKTAVVQALHTRGETYTTLGLKIKASKNWLFLTLPSGRSVCYPSPKLTEEGAITYMGVDQFSRKWVRQHTHGGKLFENLCQAIARDVIAEGLTAAEKEGYSTVLHVHDEIISEVPDTPEFNARNLADIMSRPPAWGLGMPLAAEGFEAYRYRK